MEAIRRLFSPEFRNRIDAIVQFDALDPATINRVVDKLWWRSRRSSSRRTSHCTWTTRRAPGLPGGYDPEDGRAADGARDPGTHQAAASGGALFGRLEKGGHAFVGVAPDGTLKIEVRSTEEPALLE